VSGGEVTRIAGDMRGGPGVQEPVRLPLRVHGVVGAAHGFMEHGGVVEGVGQTSVRCWWSSWHHHVSLRRCAGTGAEDPSGVGRDPWEHGPVGMGCPKGQSTPAMAFERGRLPPPPPRSASCPSRPGSRHHGRALAQAIGRRSAGTRRALGRVHNRGWDSSPDSLD
jgi:hypothetical protein